MPLALPSSVLQTSKASLGTGTRGPRATRGAATTEGHVKKNLVFALALVICMAASQNAWAATNIGLKAVGVDAGLVDVQDGGSTLGLGLSADMGTFSKDVHFSLHANYWNDSEDSFGATAAVRDISFGGRARYMFHTTSAKFQPYAGGGLGLHFYRA